MLATRIYIGLVAFSLLGSLLSRWLGLDPGPIAPAASVATLLTGCVAAFGPFVNTERRAIPTLLAVVTFGGAVEWIGLGCGFPFGRYAYTERWWPTVMLPYAGRFPLMLPFAWLLVAGSVSLIVARWVLSGPVVVAMLVGGISALIDLGMEPVMTGPLGYWKWAFAGPLPGGAPWLNFAGWFAVSAVAALIFLRGGAAQSETVRPAAWVLFGHLALVFGLALISLMPSTLPGGTVR